MGSYGTNIRMSTTRDEPMTVLRFKQDATGALSNMMAFSEGHQRYTPHYEGQETRSGLWLYHDDGIYLMSPTRQTFDNGNRGRRCNLNVVVYAEGYKRTDKNANIKCGNIDDYSAEFIPLNNDQVNHIIAGADIKINLTNTNMTIAVEKKIAVTRVVEHA